MKSPKETAVSNTPKVDKATPCHKTGLTLSHFVSRPPENRINVSANTPNDCVRFGSSKWIPPIPSDPASIPTVRKIISAGTPNFPEVLLAKILSSKSIELIKSIFSDVKVICYLLIQQS